MHATGRQPQRAPDGAPLHDGRHRPEQTMLHRTFNIQSQVRESVVPEPGALALAALGPGPLAVTRRRT